MTGEKRLTGTIGYMPTCFLLILVQLGRESAAEEMALHFTECGSQEFLICETECYLEPL